MRKTLSLILPILIPSWRFFKTVEPSPRVQWTDNALAWNDFPPLEQHVSLAQMIMRLFWNPARNDALFVVSCAERLQQAPTDHSIDEIRQRIVTHVDRTGVTWTTLQFRLVFVHRSAAGLHEDVVFVSSKWGQ